MESMRWVRVDAHAKESLAAVMDPATGEISTQRISGRPGEAVVEWLATVRQPFGRCTKPGQLAMDCSGAQRGFDVVVSAPAHILKNATDHIKVDKRDAVRLARLLSAGELRLVLVPEPNEEQLRDLVRSREYLRVDLTRIRNRIGKFLLRCETYAPQHTETWGVLHRKWLRGLIFADLASELVFEDAMHDILVARREQLERALAEIAETSTWALTIARLRCLRGIDTRCQRSAWWLRWGTFVVFNTRGFWPVTWAWCRASTHQATSADKVESLRPAQEDEFEERPLRGGRSKFSNRRIAPSNPTRKPRGNNSARATKGLRRRDEAGRGGS